MYSNPKLSIITTLYNCEQFIEESIQSVLNQTYSDFEWIIINDGSTDSTWKIATEILAEDNRVIMINSSENKKIPKRRNEAIGLARGKYVAIHDGDDISLPMRFEKEIAYLEKNDSVFCVGGHAVMIDHESEQTGIMNYPPIRHRQIVNGLLHKQLNPMIDPSTMFKREVFESLGGYTLDESIYTVPDMDLWARAIVDGRVFANLPEIIIKYRKNADGMTEKHKSEMIKAHMHVWRRFRSELIPATEGETNVKR